jgi:hypothetical protein
MSTLSRMLIGLVTGPLVAACCGAVLCAWQGGIPMFRIPDPWEAARAGFVFCFLLFGAPAAVLGALIGELISSPSGPKRVDARDGEL